MSRNRLMDTTWEPPQTGTVGAVNSDGTLSVKLDTSSLQVTCSKLAAPSAYAAGQKVLVVFFAGGRQPLVVGHE